MLTADHVRASKKRGELVLRPLEGRLRERALELAAAYLDVTQANIGSSREEIKQAWSAVPITGQEKRLADGLLKLIEDACEFSTESPGDPATLRSTVFSLAAERRRADDKPFDREAILVDAGKALGLASADLDETLYSDLRGAHVLLRAEPLKAEQLLARYDRGQVQAVLLRAVRVFADVHCRSASSYRYLFRQLKFRRLLHRIAERPDGGYRIEIDGPYSLFDSVTKYGLQLALVLPALQACDRLHLVAEIRWGKAREPLRFQFDGGSAPRNDDDASNATDAGGPHELAAIVEAFAAPDASWRVSPASEILDLPGVGLCIPDLLFEHSTGARVFFEALGYWSRDAVWQRVELVQRGLDAHILFAISEKLRVSEAVLDADHAALYVYKTTMNPRAIERKLDGLIHGLAHPAKSK